MNTSETSFDASLMQNSAAAGLPESSIVGEVAGVSGSAQMLQSPSTFVKGINFNGDAVTVNGNRWLSQNQALNDGLVLSGSNSFNENFAVSPSVNKATGDMLNTGLEASAEAGNKDLVVSQRLANGSYRVDLWAMSPTKRDRSFNVEVEGTNMGQVTVSGQKGKWQKYSYSTTVTDGKLDLVLDKVRKSPVISGIEFSSIKGGQGPTPPSALPNPQEQTPSPSPGPSSGGLPNPNDTNPPKPGSNQGSNDGDDDTSNSGNNNSAGSGGSLPDPVGPQPPSPSPSAPSPTGGKLVWENNFSGNWEQNWPNYQNTTAPGNRKVIQEGNGFGDILRVDYQKNVFGPNGGSQFKTTFAPMKSATLQYDVRFKDGFDPVLGGKLPGFTGGLPGRRRENTGGNVPDGTDGWSVRLGFRNAKSAPNALAISTYSYLPPGQQNPKQNNEYVFDAWGNKSFWSGKGKWGLSNHFLNPDNPEAGKDLLIQTGKWYTVSLQVSLNTGGKNNGFIKGFIKRPGSNKSQLALHVPNLKFQNSGSNLPIDRVFFSTFFGGASPKHAPKREEHIDFDNFKVFKHS